MIWTPFKIAQKKFLGVDIGTASIKIVELASFGEKIRLDNYGELYARAFYKRPFRTLEKSTLIFSNRDIADAIQAIFKAAKIETREAVFSIPDFSTFFTSFTLPRMTKEELPAAVKFEARQHIPLPLSEVALDWVMIENDTPPKKEEEQKILLVAVPHEVINQYQEIAQIAQVKILAMEAEVFGLARALVKEKKGLIGILDLGAQTTTINIIKDGTLKVSHSFDISGNELTRVLSRSLNIDYNKAEEMKRKEGITVAETNIAKVLLPLVDLILAEVEKITREFYQVEGREMEKIILCGGTALLPGLKEYFANQLKRPVEIANPFTNIFYPPILEETVKELGPSYSVAVGMALRRFE